MSKSLFVTGHRPKRLYGYDLSYSKYADLKAEMLRRILKAECTDLYTGLNLGVETLAAQLALENGIKLHIVLACRDQDLLWPSESRHLYNEILKQADEVVMLSSEEYTNDLFTMRQHWYVDEIKNGLVVINSDQSMAGSKAYETVEYAELKEVELDILDIGTGINKQNRVSKRKIKNSAITKEVVDMWANLDNFVVLDIETTGMSFLTGAKITEVAGLKVCGDQIVSRYEQLVNPGEPIPYDITKLTGITDTMVKHKPDIISVFPVLKQFVGDNTVVFHNSDFDYKRFLQPMHDTYMFNEIDWNVLCSLKMDRFLRPNVKSHKLGDIYEAFTNDVSLRNAHRAGVDAFMTVRVAVVLREYIRQNYAEVIARC